MDYQQKYQKVLTMIQAIKDVDPFFEQCSVFFDFVPHPSELILDYVYQSMLAIADDIKNNNITEAKKKITSMIDQLHYIHEQEMLDKTKEGNPDDLLLSL